MVTSWVQQGCGSRAPAFLSSRPSPILQTHSFLCIMAANAGTTAQSYFPLAQEREFFKYVLCIIQLAIFAVGESCLR